ncbi:metabolite traffic protein EboE [Actinokineospora sp. HUAS TT18]|uniref:metabolite traffic protein EboE n=1 Tax=Actinokineospora sp. HUAS TT18 TaxID=3447451 RepID=UPI003F5287B9
MDSPVTTWPVAYCTNVHPATDVAGLVAQFDRYAVPVRELLGTDVLPLGLWLPAPVSHALAGDPAQLAALRRELDARGLTVSTLNAFPYGGFHNRVVKHAVYWPDWTDPRRVAYTVDSAAVLAGLLPDDAEYGSVSTLPLGWGKPWTARHDDAATAAIARLTARLRAFSIGHGRPIRLAVEPEPGCVLDTVADAVGWLANRVDPDHVGICLDTCHLAVSFADPAETVATIRRAGLSVVKVQASAALEAADPIAAQAVLADFDEPRYLHQVRENSPTGVLAADDLPDAFAGLPGEHPWRVHFHVPLHIAPPAPLTATTDVLTDTLRAVGPGPHVEVETYTWPVLPGADPARLATGIAGELRWAADNLPS